jgi:hypothetical protein
MQRLIHAVIIRRTGVDITPAERRPNVPIARIVIGVVIVVIRRIQEEREIPIAEVAVVTTPVVPVIT